jgi:hypothetical protein
VYWGDAMKPSKELVESARQYLNSQQDSKIYGPAHPTVISHAEFGERVARECAEIARGNQPDRLYDEGQGSQDYLMGRRMACRAIRSRFGLAEEDQR